ncbi:MAG TPA: sigma factor-like helix-turn-helix DNA-binding protein, partial [Mycobacteriales bacterium]|nr:sigma factor-like helix-turn-helix DNA-binding protein [Mycobacteriales bacterium]
MRDKRGFAEFAAARAAAVRRQALLLTGEPERAGRLAERALADTARHWDRLVASGGVAAAEEHARRRLATATLKRPARGHGSRSGGVPPAEPGARAERSVAPPTSGRPRPVPAAEGSAGALAPSVPAGGDSSPSGSAPEGSTTATAVRPAPGTAVRTAQDGVEAPHAGASPQRQPESDSDATWRALASLPPRRRVVLVLRYDEGLGDEAAGARVGLPPGTVAAEAEAGLAALRSILRRRGRPEDLVPVALADPVRTPPTAARPVVDGVPGRPGRRRRRLLAVGLATVTAGGAAVLVAVLLSRGASADLPASAPARAGQLEWSARGPLVADADTLRAALRAWQGGVPAAERPGDAAVLYAGRPDGDRLVLLQGTDPRGLVRLAEIADTGGALAVRRTQPLGRTAPIVSLSAGDGRLVRLLVPADAADGGEVLVRDPGLPLDTPLRRLAVDADGLSEPLDPGVGGVPVVVVRGGQEPVVAGSGVVSAGALTPLPGSVQIGATALALGGSGQVRSVWYDDGRLLARQLGGPVVVAAAGPQVNASLVVGGSSRPVVARTYEARRAGLSSLATVVRVGSAPACVYTSRLGPVDA